MPPLYKGVIKNGGFKHEVFQETETNVENIKPPSFKEQVLDLIKGLFKELKSDKV